MDGTVAVTTGGDRAALVRAALDRLPAPPVVATARRIVVKPNLVSVLHPAAVTHVDALAAVLQWLRDRGARQVTIAEGSAADSTMAAFSAHGYGRLTAIPGLEVRLVDLNQDEGAPITLYTRQLAPQTVHVARTIVESDLLISLALPKTHDAVVVTGALKNVLMGSLINRQAGGGDGPGARMSDRLMRLIPAAWRPIEGLEAVWPGLAHRLTASDKAAVHHGPAVINLNLFLLARRVRPHLAILDGATGMEGNGPVHGEAVALGWAAASRDAVALDAVMAHLIGHDPSRVGYLHYCHRAGIGVADLSAITVLGVERLEHLQRFCRPHATIARQLQWADPRVDAIVNTLANGEGATAAPGSPLAASA